MKNKFIQEMIDHIRGKSKESRFQKLKKFSEKLNIEFKETITAQKSNRRIEIIIPCIDKDSDVLPMVIDSARKFILHPISKINIISPQNSSKIKQICVEKDCIFTDENTLLPFASKDIDYTVKGINLAGWLYQQFLKMAWCDFSEEKYYLTLDSDTVFIRPMSFEYNNKTLLEYTDEYHRPYFDTLKKLGFSTYSPVSFIAHHMLFNKTIMQDLLKEIESKNNTIWYDAIQQKLDKNIHSGFSEFETYGRFLIEYHPKEIILEYWFNKSINSNEFSTIESLIEEYKNQYKTLSFHSWNKV